MDRDDILARIEKRIYTKSPGVFLLLNLNCKNRFGSSFARLLLEDPSKLYKIITDTYRDEITANFIFKDLLVKSLATELGYPDMADSLYEAALKDQEKYKSLIQDMMKGTKET